MSDYGDAFRAAHDRKLAGIREGWLYLCATVDKLDTDEGTTRAHGMPPLTVAKAITADLMYLAKLEEEKEKQASLIASLRRDIEYTMSVGPRDQAAALREALVAVIAPAISWRTVTSETDNDASLISLAQAHGDSITTHHNVAKNAVAQRTHAEAETRASRKEIEHAQRVQKDTEERAVFAENRYAKCLDQRILAEATLASAEKENEKLRDEVAWRDAAMLFARAKVQERTAALTAARAETKEAQAGWATEHELAEIWRGKVEEAQTQKGSAESSARHAHAKMRDAVKRQWTTYKDNQTMWRKVAKRDAALVFLRAQVKEHANTPEGKARTEAARTARRAAKAAAKAEQAAAHAAESERVKEEMWRGKAIASRFVQACSAQIVAEPFYFSASAYDKARRILRKKDLK